MVISSGLFSIADYLRGKGLKVSILHLGIEKILNPKFSLRNFIKDTNPKIIGFSMHWHLQVSPVIEISSILKKYYPDIFIILGGITASFFHEEIMNKFSAIDGVIRGDGEEPLALLIKAVLGKKVDLSDIPNLTWKNNTGTVINKTSYQIIQKELNALNYTNFNLLKNKSFYIQCSSLSLNWFNNLGVAINKRIANHRKTLYIPINKGCPVSCSYCGGRNKANHDGQNEYFMFRSVESVFNSIKSAYESGFGTVEIYFLPIPESKYYQRLFSMIKSSGMNINCVLECFVLPDKELLDLFVSSFRNSDKNLIYISPESLDEHTRNMNKGFMFSNEDMLNFLSHTDKLCIPTMLFFSLGLPFENPAFAEQILHFKKYIYSNFKNVSITGLPIEVVPGSPIYNDPQKYNLVKTKYSLSDFFSDECVNSKQPKYSRGFYKEMEIPLLKTTAEKLKYFEDSINKMRCRYCCTLENRLSRNFIFKLLRGNFLCELFLIVACKLFRFSLWTFGLFSFKNKTKEGDIWMLN
ncbi:MAG: cobalamin-dependent protein [Candidatus Omnitrophota bacterium]